MIDLLSEMVRARQPWLSPSLCSWYDDARLASQLASALGIEADRVGDQDFGSQLRDRVGLAIGDPADWANRRIDLPVSGWSVCGIRFRGGDVERPFVDVVATTEPPTPDGLAAVAETVLPQYQAFGPLCLRVQAPDAAALVMELRGDPRFGPRCEVDMHIVAGQVKTLLAQPRASSYNRIALRVGDAHVLAERVAAIYAGLAPGNPALASWATPEGEKSLAECALEGLLLEVLADGEHAGVVAALREDAHGMSGFCIREICLDVGHQGQRLAAAVQQQLLEQLPAADGDVLWGTIHPDNSPSLRNAASIGRRPVGGYAWITPEGLPGMGTDSGRGARARKRVTGRRGPGRSPA